MSRNLLVIFILAVGIFTILIVRTETIPKSRLGDPCPLQQMEMGVYEKVSSVPVDDKVYLILKKDKTIKMVGPLPTKDYKSHNYEILATRRGSGKEEIEIVEKNALESE